MSKMTTKLTGDELMSGSLVLNMELPDSVRKEIAERVGVLLGEGEIRKLRLQSAEKMREEIRQATKKVMLEEGLYAEIKMNVGVLIESEIKSQVLKKLEGTGDLLESHIRKVFKEIISNAVGNPKGPVSGDKLGLMMEKIVTEEVRKFVAEQLIIRFVPKEATF